MAFAAVWIWPVHFEVLQYAIMGAPTIYRFSHWQEFLVNVNTFAKHFACAVREAETKMALDSSGMVPLQPMFVDSRGAEERVVREMLAC